MNSQIKELHTARSGRFLSAGASVPVELGVTPNHPPTSWHVALFTDSEALWTL